ncbi:hypothetical protein L228DRAFT_236561 [Xylona heveae TC161]|uniref:Uncharacterized protein n=1 Tax=Xylona heveae (strain CBS 132557 / TC161) TaxID=1328760 RepID=A0A165IW78_XYLHT|nr:hypothetical protein L228DRAFT_236561 [Xylona heveae TC161]KZF25466.1 hypothetical protein L228DRAFT_236561 [Xylona heveae TC161]
MWLRRLSRGQKGESDDFDSPTYIDQMDSRRSDPKKSTQYSSLPNTPAAAPHDIPYRNTSQGPSDASYAQRPHSVDYAGIMEKPSLTSTPSKGAGPAQAMPDLLTQAFNAAVRPYTDKVEQLETQVADMQLWIEQLETQRSEILSWIDKRGFRPDVPPSIAKVMDAQPEAAQTLNYQLDRKISMVDLDLHRLQDDLNDSSGASYIAAQAMTKFLPDIDRLSGLSRGSRFAFDLLIKLAGNLNSHGGLDASDGSQETRRAFYEKLDLSMLDVVRRRLDDTNEDWPVVRDVKRIEKTAAYLRNYGIEPYFPRSLELMRREMDARSGGSGAGSL